MSEIIRAVGPDEHEGALNVWATVWPDYGARQFYNQYFEKDPWQKDEYTRLCEVDGKLVACVQLCKRPVQTPLGELTMGAIANVATLVEYRGRGYSSKLLKSAIEIMERENFDFSVLFTGITDFYARLGWHSVTGSLINAKLDLARPAPPTAPTVDEAPPAVDELKLVYDAFNAGRPIASTRPESYWRWVMGRLDGCRWISVRDSGRLVGYAAVLVEQGRVNLREYGWLPGHEEAAGPLTAGIAAAAAAGGVGDLLGIVPWEPALLDGLKAAGYVTTLSEFRNGMFRRINMDPGRYQSLCAQMATPPAVVWGADHF